MNYYCLSDIGLKRQKNQDSYCVVKNDFDDSLFLVCDGIGGGKAGEVASGEVVKYFINNFKTTSKFTDKEETIKYLKQTIEDINKQIFNLSIKYREFSGMGTTLTGLLIAEDYTYTINVGDSRVYGYIDSKLIKLTKDHTLVNDMIDKGEITYEQSLTHPKRHYLMKAIGVWDIIEPDIHEIKKMDGYVICSDGLHGYVDDKDIVKVLNKKNASVQDKCKSLMNLALLQGGYDNITIIVIE